MWEVRLGSVGGPRLLLRHGGLLLREALALLLDLEARLLELARLVLVGLALRALERRALDRLGLRRRRALLLSFLRRRLRRRRDAAVGVGPARLLLLRHPLLPLVVREAPLVRRDEARRAAALLHHLREGRVAVGGHVRAAHRQVGGGGVVRQEARVEPLRDLLLLEGALHLPLEVAVEPVDRRLRRRRARGGGGRRQPAAARRREPSAARTGGGRPRHAVAARRVARLPRRALLAHVARHPLAPALAPRVARPALLPVAPAAAPALAAPAPAAAAVALAKAAAAGRLALDRRARVLAQLRLLLRELEHVQRREEPAERRRAVSGEPCERWVA